MRNWAALSYCSILPIYCIEKKIVMKNFAIIKKAYLCEKNRKS